MELLGLILSAARGRGVRFPGNSCVKRLRCSMKCCIGLPIKDTWSASNARLNASSTLRGSGSRWRMTIWGFMRETPQVQHEVLYRITYQGYMEREQREIERLKHVERIRIPLAFDYLGIPGLRRESAMKLNHIKPLTLGQASRMSGVNPTDISLLMVAIEAQKETDSAA